MHNADDLYHSNNYERSESPTFRSIYNHTYHSTLFDRTETLDVQTYSYLYWWTWGMETHTLNGFTINLLSVV